MEQLAMVSDDQTPEGITDYAMYMSYCVQRRAGLSHAQLVRIGFPDVFINLYEQQNGPNKTETF